MATIAEIATGSDDFNILVAALGFIDDTLETELIATIADPEQDLTVFAPTDAAFGALATDLGFSGDATDEDAVTGFLVGLGAELLNDVVTYHISAGAQDAATIAAAGEVTTLNGTITAELPRLIDNEPDLLDPAVTTANLAADNGIIHAIDRVLLPVDLDGNDAPTITGIVAASGELDTNGADFDILLAAVSAAGLAETLDDADANLTVFAPDDAAFTGLATLLGYDGDATDEGAVLGFILEALSLLSASEDPIPLLTDVLTYHVAGDDLISEQVIDLGTIGTLLGPDITLDGLFLDDQDPDLPNPQLQTLDIQAANGIVHVIDGVLIPADLLPSTGTGDLDFIISGNGADDLALGANNDFADGNGGRDEISGGAGNDVILGGKGNDDLSGNRNADTINGGEGNDEIDGNKGRDELLGSHGDDDISGGQGNDVLRGNGGSDELDGGQGDDVIAGGKGDDILSGGAGADRFVLRAAPGDDVIEDFHLGIDVLGLKTSGFANKGAVLDAFDQVGDDAVLTFANGDTVTLEDIDVDALSTTDLIV